MKKEHKQYFVPGQRLNPTAVGDGIFTSFNRLLTELHQSEKRTGFFSRVKIISEDGHKHALTAIQDFFGGENNPDTVRQTIRDIVAVSRQSFIQTIPPNISSESPQDVIAGRMRLITILEEGVSRQLDPLDLPIVQLFESLGRFDGRIFEVIRRNIAEAKNTAPVQSKGRYGVCPSCGSTASESICSYCSSAKPLLN